MKQMLCILIFLVTCTFAKPWRFAVLGDTHVNVSDTLQEMIPFMLEDSLDFVLVSGDIVDGGKRCTADSLKNQLTQWLELFAPLRETGVPVYPIRGNHENDVTGNIDVWNSVFSGDNALPKNGPSTELNRTYSFQNKNALVIGLDVYQNIHTVDQSWLDSVLDTAQAPHIFLFGHEPAFKVFHADCLDDSVVQRDRFWNSLKTAGVKAYFCGHDHFLDIASIDDGDGDSSNDIYQCLVGTGGGWRMSKYNYVGENSSFTPRGINHQMEHGYMVVEISGETESDRGVNLFWHPRTVDPVDGTVSYDSAVALLSYELPASTTSVSAAKAVSSNRITMYGSELALNLVRSGPIRIELFGLNGKRITMIDQTGIIGENRIAIPTLTAGMTVVRVSGEGFCSTVKWFGR